MKPILITKFPFASRYGGGEQHTLTLFQHLADKGERFYFLGSCAVLLREFRQRHWPAQRLVIGKEPVAWWSLGIFPFTTLFTIVLLGPALVWYRVVRRVRTLYALSLTEKVLITPWARLLGMRVLWVEHVEIGRWLRKSPLRVLYRWWSRLARIVVVSRVIRDQLGEIGVKEDRVVIVHGGVDVQAYPETHRRTFHWTKRFVVGTVARLEKEKGIAYLLRAFQQLLLVVPHAQLIIVGDGSERHQLEWVARQLGIERCVQWVGFQRNIPQWMKSFDCFVLPSVVRESFGLVLIEAMASACPVIASNIGGIPEVVTNNRTGILVEPGDAELLMQALLFCYQHPDVAMQLGEQGRRYVEEHFTVEQMFAGFTKLFV